MLLSHGGRRFIVQMNVSELLQQFARNRSEEVFSDIMRQHVHLVYSVAHRRLQDPNQIEEVVQDVFIRLARVPRVPASQCELISWLHATVHRIAIDRWRQDSRRQEREFKAASTVDPATEPDWNDVSPVLDEAIAELEATDREAILLRFVNDVPFRDVAQTLGVTDAAAKMRTRRALDKLRDHLTRKGLTCSAAALAGMLDQAATTQAPAGFANRVVSMIGRSVFVGGRVLVRKAPSVVSVKTVATVLILGTGLFLWLNRNRPSRQWNRARMNRTETTAQQASFTPRRPNSGKRISLGNASTPDLMARLRWVLDQAHAIKNYPPNELLQILLECPPSATEALALLTEYLASPDYETRHWAAEGLQVLVQDDQFKAVSGAARLALMRVAASTTESELLRNKAFTAAISRPWADGLTPGKISDPPPIADELLQTFLSSFSEKGVDMVSSVGGRAAALATSLAQTKQDFSSYQHALESMLATGDANQKYAAAIALAGLPGEKAPAIKPELLRLLDSKDPHLPPAMAVIGLGQLGPAASDTVSALEQSLERYPADPHYKTLVETALNSIQPGRAEAAALEARPTESKNPSEEPLTSSLKDYFGKIADELKDPQARRAFVPQDRWTDAYPYWTVQSTRQARDEIARTVDPEIGELIRKIPVGLHVIDDTPVDLDAEVDPREFIGRAIGIASRSDSGISADSLARVTEMFRRESSRLEKVTDLVMGGSQAEKLAESALTIGAFDAQLYRATLKSILDDRPELDRILRGTEPVVAAEKGRKKP